LLSVFSSGLATGLPIGYQSLLIFGMIISIWIFAIFIYAVPVNLAWIWFLRKDRGLANFLENYEEIGFIQQPSPIKSIGIEKSNQPATSAFASRVHN
jgi:hypothetical protein